ncbi:hypothetical protein B4914_08220 [Yersinia entomophaga]|nr:hypothetical protein B4914_08220 [Yersinia entomophaga]
MAIFVISIHMLLLLVMEYGLTLFYLTNPIGNDIHCVYLIEPQDILPMSMPTPVFCYLSGNGLAGNVHLLFFCVCSIDSATAPAVAAVFISKTRRSSWCSFDVRIMPTGITRLNVA